MRFFFCGQTYQLGTNGTTFQCANGCDMQMQEVFVEPCNCPQYNLPIAPADSCQTAPSFCASYLNGYCSSNLGFSPDIPGNLASVIPCTIENNQWLKFVACETEAQLEFGVSNCLSATGLEFFVLQTTDCQIFVTQSACFEVADGASDTITLVGLTLGETYYLMVDGIGGDICSWEILSTVGVSDGATYQEDNTPGQVTGPASVCAGGSASFTFTSPICDLIPVGGCPAAFQQVCTPQLDSCFASIQYDTIWHVTPAGTVFMNDDSMGLTVTVVFPDTLPVPPSGFLEFTISVELVPVLADTLPCCPAECLQIIPDTEPCAILPLVIRVCAPESLSEYHVICPGECVNAFGQTFCSPGTFTVTKQDECGCTDTYTVVIDWITESPTTVSPPSFACAPDGTTYTVSFDLISFGNFVLVDGQPFFGTTYTSAPIPSGQPFLFLVTSIGVCGPSFSIPVSGSHTCPPCIGGTNDLGTITLCPGECYPLLGNSYCNPGSYSELLYDPVLDCYETYIFTLEQIVEATLATGPVAEFCEATNLYYSVGFSIEGGTAPFLVNGNPVTGNFYQSGLIPTGQPYAFTVTDAATCNPQEINIGGIFTCPCVNSPGTVELAVIHQCEGEMATVGFNNDAVVGPGELLVFVLHTSSGGGLGTVVGVNATGSFGYVLGLMNLGQTYYISPAVGPDLGGTVDFNSSCFKLSPGQPIVFYSKPEVDILQPDTLTCSINSLTLNSLPNGGSGDYGFEWAGPSNFSSNLANPAVSEAGTYLLTLTDNLTGCKTQSATAVASDTALPVFTVTSSEINCQQPNATLEAVSQMPGVTYTWTFPTGGVQTGATISTNIPGDYAVTALGTNGCSAQATTFVMDNGVPPSISAIGGTINCAQPTAQLVASSNEPSATFTWTLPDGSVAAGATLSTSLLGSYMVVLSAPNGCTAEATAAVAEGPDPDLVTEVEVTHPTCFGYSDGSIKVLGTTGGTAPYEYTLNDSLAGDFFQNLSAGDYLLTTTDANGCPDEDVVQLIEPQEVMVQIGDDQFIQLGQSITLTMQASITPDSIVWLGPNGRVWPDVNSLTISPTAGGRYSIVISDVNSCRSSDTTYIYVNGEGKVFVPNVFSPNGDGNNDRMMIFAGGDVERILEFQIFDRWGELVFQDKNFVPNDPVHGWDGRHKGKPMDPAVFVVRAMVAFKDGTKQLVLGDVVLLR